jgi:hypothetical protein
MTSPARRFGVGKMFFCFGSPRSGTTLISQSLGAMLYDPIGPSRIGSYRDALSPELIALCERQAREGMETFGYD